MNEQQQRIIKGWNIWNRSQEHEDMVYIGEKYLEMNGFKIWPLLANIAQEMLYNKESDINFDNFSSLRKTNRRKKMLRSPNHIPDIYAYKDGRWIFVEAKSHKERFVSQLETYQRFADEVWLIIPERVNNIKLISSMDLQAEVVDNGGI